MELLANRLPQQLEVAVTGPSLHALPHELPCHTLGDAPRPVSPPWSSQGCFLGTPLIAVIPHSAVERACTKADHLSHVYFEFPSQPVEWPSMKEVTSCANCHTMPWSLSFSRASFCTYGGGRHYSWPCLCLTRHSWESCQLLAGLYTPLEFLLCRNLPVHCNTPLRCRMHLHQS